jgi:hypothetical protein
MTTNLPPHTMSPMSAVRVSRPGLVVGVVVGLIGWVGILWIGRQLASLEPPRAGDDLRILVDAAGRMVEGGPLYETSPSTGSLLAESLFYSYPPPVAQALVPFAGMRLQLLLVLWGVGATAGLALFARLVSRPGRGLVVPALAVAPFTYPLAVALLFGNVNAWFPSLFGVLLAAVIASGRALSVAGGAALAVAVVTKLHPATLWLWLIARAVRKGPRGSEGQLAAIAAFSGAAILLASLACFGASPWTEYAAFLGSGSGTADIVTPLNIGPASQLSLLLGLSDASARSIQVVVAAVALVATVLAARGVADPVESFGLAVVASLVVLPVTWFHYPVAMIPVGLAAMARARGPAVARTAALLGGAVLVAGVAIVLPVVVWVAVGLVLLAAWTSRPAYD